MANVDKFAKLRGKVKYIWIQSCNVGAVDDLAGRIAFYSQAWVTAYAMGTPNLENIKANHIDYPLASIPKHWYGPGCSLGTKNGLAPKGSTEFFASARSSAQSDMSSLDFNIIEPYIRNNEKKRP